jgi:hypothetical protein
MLQVQAVGYGKVRSERRVHLHWPSPTCASSLTADLEVGQGNAYETTKTRLKMLPL